MRIRAGRAALPLILLSGCVAAQDAHLTLPDFKSLGGKAIESVNISLNPLLLHTAAAFLDDKDPEAAKTKHLLASIRNIEIRSYEFASDFAYSADELDGVRRQLGGPGWSQLMRVHHADKSEDVDMYLLIDNNVTKGFALIASEPRRFTIINIVGSIDVADLPKLESRLHLPPIAAAQALPLM